MTPGNEDGEEGRRGHGQHAANGGVVAGPPPFPPSLVRDGRGEEHTELAPARSSAHPRARPSAHTSGSKAVLVRFPRGFARQQYPTFMFGVLKL